MEDGEWLTLGGPDGETIAAVCVHGRDGRRTLLSELGDRLYAREDGSYESLVDGRRYRIRTDPAPGRASEAYRVAFEAADGYARVLVDGDFRHALSVAHAWDAAFVRAAGLDLRRLLLVRGPGRVAGALVNLAQLHDFGDRGHAVERVAVMVAPEHAGRAAMFATVAALRGYDVRVFEDEGVAAAWLRG